MLTTLSATLGWPITVIQSSKKKWVDTYVVNENIRKGLNEYVDKQTVFVYQIVKNVEIVAQEVSKELGKFPSYK